MAGKIRIVIVDDHVMFREAVEWILGHEPDFEVVGHGGSADEAMVMARDLLPDILLLDIDMPGDSFAAAQAISFEFPQIRIAFLTISGAEHHFVKALSVGACAYILKGVSARELVRILRGVVSGDCYVPPSLADVLSVR